MKKLADIYINIPVKSIAKAYTYIIPEKFDILKEGCRVLVPFGNRIMEGFIIKIYANNEHNIDITKLKEIKDIIDTEKEMLKSPFDRNTAIGQVEKNCMSYPELALGVTVPIAIRGRSLEQMTNDDILKILQLQFGILMAEEGVRGIRNQ